MENQIDTFCASSFLTFRYVVDKKKEWLPGWKPWWPENDLSNQIPVNDEAEVISFLKEQFLSIDKNNCGILLSGGIDSAILASFLPAGTHAYTIRFIAEGAVDESKQASVYANYLKLNHHIVDVYWEDFEKYSGLLMNHKKSPLHAIEVGIYKAALFAKNDNLKQLVVGNGADSTFGGMDKLLSKDWEFNEFVHRYNFIEPAEVLKDPIDLSYIYNPFKEGIGISVQKFLKTVHGEGIIQTFCNAAESAGIKLIEPFESIKYTKPLDLNRIRNGESKYILRSVFNKMYPNFYLPEKIPFARPMDQWLSNWAGPKHKLFKHDLNLSKFTGDQKWLIYNLEQFFNLIEK